MHERVETNSCAKLSDQASCTRNACCIIPNIDYHKDLYKVHLVRALERRHGLALVLVEGVVRDRAVSELHVRRLDVRLERKRVLHPLLVITLWRA
jgi:hypothetical protein